MVIKDEIKMKPANAMTQTGCKVSQHKLRLVTSRVSMILQATYVQHQQMSIISVNSYLLKYVRPISLILNFLT